jgi:hypothetical protein
MYAHARVTRESDSDTALFVVFTERSARSSPVALAGKKKEKRSARARDYDAPLVGSPRSSAFTASSFLSLR